MNTQDSQHTNLAGCLTRIAWMFGGYMLLLMVAASIVVNRGALLTPRDAAFWAVVVAVVVLRYVDVRYLHGDTADGRPATMRDWRRYSLAVVGAAVLLWLAAHAVVLLRG